VQSRHLWTEVTFPSFESPTTADAKGDCGAKGDNTTDDTFALQTCINEHRDVFLPPGRYRISATLYLRPGSRLVGVSNTLSVIASSTDGFPSATTASPQPMLQTSDADDDGNGDASATVLAFFGLVAFQHVPDVFTLDVSKMLAHCAC
jgi:polygalacturonase